MAGTFDNLRSIKGLLIKGASRKLLTLNNETPLDFANRLNTPDQRAAIIKILEPPSTFCCHLKQPMKKVSPSRKHALTFLALICSTYLLCLLFVYPHVSLFWFPLNSSLLTVTLVMFLLTSYKSPGYMRSGESVNLLKLLENNFDPNNACPACELVCKPDSRHCYICDECVSGFDHHCQWVNNCIGKGNHMVFYLYVLVLSVYLIAVALMSGLNVFRLGALYGMFNLT